MKAQAIQSIADRKFDQVKNWLQTLPFEGFTGEDLFIKQFIKDDIMKLLEGENIKNKIFNFEQDLWSF